MRSAHRALPVVLAVALAATAPALAAGDLVFLAGVRGLDDGFWGPVADHAVAGLAADFGKDTWPVTFALAIHVSGATDDLARPAPHGSEVEAAVADLDLGILYTWRGSDLWTPYAGGGVSAVNVWAKVKMPGGDVDDDDLSAAAWARAGVRTRLGRSATLGVDFRLLRGSDIELFGASGDADSMQVTLQAGWSWPAGR